MKLTELLLDEANKLTEKKKMKAFVAKLFTDWI